MPAINLIAWINFIAAGILALATFAGNIAFLSPAVAAAISGCLFLAIDRALILLAEIRDRLPEPSARQPEQPSKLPEGTPTRSLAEIEADLERMKSRKVS